MCSLLQTASYFSRWSKKLSKSSWEVSKKRCFFGELLVNVFCIICPFTASILETIEVLIFELRNKNVLNLVEINFNADKERRKKVKKDMKKIKRGESESCRNLELGSRLQ